MEIYLNRQYRQPDFTIGLLFYGPNMPIFTLEDEKRDIKIKHETRIPAGRYKIELRNEGSMNIQYKQRFKFHKGMLWLKDVPKFEYVYLHVGNTDEDTSGCPLVGNVHEIGRNMISKSVLAYSHMYQFVYDHLKKGVEVYINVVDELMY